LFGYEIGKIRGNGGRGGGGKGKYHILQHGHHAKTNDIFLLGGRVGPSPLSKMDRVEVFLMETLRLQIGFRFHAELFCRMYLYWEQIAS
jgi:hypothetical protein